MKTTMRHVLACVVACNSAAVGLADAQSGAASIVDPGPQASPEAKGYFIAARSDASDRGFGDSEVRLTMVLKNKNGETATRKMRQLVLEVPELTAGDKSINIFDSPKDVEGTALLSHAKILDADDQWLYLPALKRVKRISSANKSGPFLGSEFAYEDVTAQELRKFGYRFLRSEPCGDLVCDVVERTPKYENSGYTRNLLWVDQRDHQFRKIEFYDRGNALLKTLDYLEYKKYDDAVWRAHRLVMVNHQTKKETELRFSAFKFAQGLEDSDFVKSRLKRR